MDDGLTLLNIILLAIAVGVFLKLRSVLGRRTGHERPPYDPYSSDTADANGNDKVVTLPKRPRAGAPAGSGANTRDGVIDIAADPFAEPFQVKNRRSGTAGDGTPLAATRTDMASLDRQFDAEAFLGGAKAAYEMIVTAYASGDRATRKPLLSDEVY